MQLFLLSVTVILAILLYKLLSSQRTTYPFVRTTRLTRADDAEYLTTESEHGLITVDKNTVVVNGHEYSLKNDQGDGARAYLNVAGGKLISICIRQGDEEKYFFIDPSHSLFATLQEKVSGTPTPPSYIFSV